MIFGIPAWLFWLIIMIAALVVEALTFNMTTIWFAAGSLAAMIIALFVYRSGFRSQLWS